MVSLVNAERLAMNKPPLGFLNPVLYSLNRNVFNDITSGINNCNVEAFLCCNEGFEAVQGWVIL